MAEAVTQHNAAPAIPVQPFFLDTPGGRVFAVHHAPDAVRGHVLCIPPFNEEMNRCRSMLTLQAQALAAGGYGTLVIDLFGTGDSDGEHADGRWELWQDNIGAAVRRLDERGGCMSILGVRMGVILAAEWLQANPQPLRSLVAWQPVVDGKQHLTQFLRVRIAAALDRTDAPKESTSSLRAALASGDTIEVGGYELHPALASAIDSRTLVRTIPPPATRVAWLEQRGSSGDTPSPASAKAIEAWAGSGVEVTVLGFDGPAFWQLHERAVAVDAIARTTRWLLSLDAGA
jgi:exosortase A-associated hydrolase 2